MATVRAGSQTKATSSSRTIVKKPTGYGYLIGADSELLPMGDALTTKLYGDRLSDELTSSLREKTENTRSTYARSHSTAPVKIKTAASFVSKSGLPTRRPLLKIKGKETPVEGGEVEPGLGEPISTSKGKEPIDAGSTGRTGEKKVVARSTQDSYPLVNAGLKGKATKIPVERIQPRFPGDDVPSSSIRTEVGEIPTLDIRMRPPGTGGDGEGDLTPEIVENPKLIKPFAIQQKNLLILEDPEFLRRFKLTKENAVGAYNINDLKRFAKELGLQTQFSRAQLITSIDSEINAVGVESEKEEE